MKTVLIVEDIELNRELLAQLLEGDHRLVFAQDGVAALERAAEAMPDLILMDLSLPRMDGWEATRRLKANQSTRAIPVLVLTAYGHDLAHRLAQEMGCSEVLVKPVDPRYLQQRVAFHGTHPTPDPMN